MKHMILEIDALGYSKVNPQYTPRLYSLFQNGFFKSVKTLLGYSSTIAPSIFSGKYPEEHNIWGVYKMSPNTSPFKVPKIIPRSFVDKYPLMRYGVNRLIFRNSKMQNLIPKYLAILNMPLQLIEYFDLSIKKEIMELKSLGDIPTIFDLMEMKGISFKYVGYPWFSGTENILNIAKQSLESNSVVYAFIDEIDHNGHVYGVSSKDYIERLKSFDEICANFLNKIIDTYNDITITVFSDHGMADVTGMVDMQNVIESSGLKLEKDFIYFLDSTIAKFWALNEKAKERLITMLTNTKGGHLLNHDEIIKYKINFKSNANGDLLYLANTGNVIMPNFFSIISGKIKAMHGWDPEDPSQNSFIFTNQKLTMEIEDVTKYFSLLRDIIKV